MAGGMPAIAGDEDGPAELKDYLSFLANNQAYRLLLIGEVRSMECLSQLQPELVRSAAAPVRPAWHAVGQLHVP